VINEASSDAMKTIALACSSESPRRAIGTCVTRAALSLRRVRKAGQHAGVYPDQVPPRFTRMPDLTVSSATDFVMPFDGVLAAHIDGSKGRALHCP